MRTAILKQRAVHLVHGLPLTRTNRVHLTRGHSPNKPRYTSRVAFRLKRKGDKRVLHARMVKRAHNYEGGGQPPAHSCHCGDSLRRESGGDIQVHTHIHGHTLPYRYSHNHADVFTFTFTHAHKYTHSYILSYAYTVTHMHMYMVDIYRNLHTLTHTHSQTHTSSTHTHTCTTPTQIHKCSVSGSSERFCTGKDIFVCWFSLFI